MNAKRHPAVSNAAAKQQARAQAIEASIAVHLMEKYGPVLDLGSVAKVLGFRTPEALERSLERGQLQLPLMNLPHRRGKFMLAHDLAHHLASHSKEPLVETDSKDKSASRKERPG